MEAKDKDMKTAKADVDSRSNALINSCINMGVEQKDISSTALQIRPEYEYRDDSRVFSGTIVSRQIEITVKDLKNYPDLMMSLVESKVTQTISTKLSVSNGKSLSNEALVNALKDARLQAEIMAKASGKELGDVHSVSEFDTRSFELMLLSSTSRKAGGITKGTAASQRTSGRSEPFKPGLITVTAEAYVVYLLK